MKLCVYVVGITTITLGSVAFGQIPDPRPGPSTPVTVVNTPLPVTGTISGNVNATVTGNVNATITGTPQVKIATDQVAFTKGLCLPSCVAGSPDSFTVPSITAGGLPIKELVIDFVSGICTGTGRIAEVDLSAKNGPAVVADTGDNFSRNYFPLAVDQYNSALGQNGVQAFAQQTHITYAPGTIVSMSYSIVQGGENFCQVQMNGHFVTT